MDELKQEQSEIIPPQRDLQAEKFEEFKAHVLETDLQFLEMFKEYTLKLKDGQIKEGTQQHKDEIKKLMSFNQKVPENFQNLRLTEQQKVILQEEQEIQKFNF